MFVFWKFTCTDVHAAMMKELSIVIHIGQYTHKAGIKFLTVGYSGLVDLSARGGKTRMSVLAC
jgi:hypothetical protein